MSSIEVYLFDPVTKEYAGASSAQQSPLEPGSYLMPENCTPIKPLVEKIGFVQVFCGDKWQYVKIKRHIKLFQCRLNLTIFGIEIELNIN